MRVAVTGGAGFIGGHLCHALVGEHEVTAIDNCRSGDWSRVPGAVECFDLDINDPTVPEWADILKGVDVLFHLAAEKYNSSKSSPQKVIDTNINATARLFQAAALAGVGRTVFTSSLYAYGGLGPSAMREDQVLAPTTYYGMSKAAGEDLLRIVGSASAMEWACARLFFVYGPHQYAEGGYKSVIMHNFERMMRGDPPTINGSGEQRLDYVYVDDAVDALLRLAATTTSGLILNIGSGEAVTINELVLRMRNVANVRASPVFHAADWTEGTARWADTSRARQELQWSANTSLEAGLREVWSWLNRS